MLQVMRSLTVHGHIHTHTSHVYSTHTVNSYTMFIAVVMRSFMRFPGIMSIRDIYIKTKH